VVAEPVVRIPRAIRCSALASRHVRTVVNVLAVNGFQDLDRIDIRLTKTFLTFSTCDQDRADAR